MTPIQLLRMIWARRAVVLLLALVCLVVGGLVGTMQPKRYEATARILLTLQPDLVTGEGVSRASTKAYVQAQAEIIRDARVAAAVVDRLGWTRMPEFIAAYRAQSSGSDGGIRNWLAQGVIDNTSVAPTSQSNNILDISYSADSPEAAREVAEAIRTAYIEQSLNFKRESARKNAQWFRQQRDKLKRELATAEARKSRFEQKNGIILQDDNTDTETAKLRAMASVVPALPAAAAPVVLPPSALSAQIAQIDSQIATARQSLGPNHPEVLALRRQRDALSGAAAREQAAARAAAAASRPGSTAPMMQSLMDAQTRKVLAQRGLVGEAQRLASEVAVLRDQFGKTAAKAAEFELQAQSTEVGLEPIGNVVAPDQAITLNFFLFLIGGIAAGVCLGLTTALAIEYLFRRVRGVEDLGAIEGLPVLGSLPARVRRNRDIRYWLGIDGNRGLAAA